MGMERRVKFYETSVGGLWERREMRMRCEGDREGGGGG